MKNNIQIRFPKNFFWGAATSGHQVEGNNHNDWSEWEKSKARIKNLESRIKDKNFKKNFPPHLFEKWPTPLNLENYVSGRACDHYNCFEKDFAIAELLGHNSHRFSIEWSRIEPKEGCFDEKEIEHYSQVIAALKKLGIKPFVTIWHWTIPIWLKNKGGWQCEQTSDYFVRYAEKLSTSLGKDVEFWITLNEPEIYAAQSYFTGVWPPQKRNILAYLRVLRNLIKAHRKAYRVIKKTNPNSKIGIAKNNIYFEARENKFINRILKKSADWWWNFYFLNQIKDCQDFIGLNHYFHNRINYGFNKNENRKTSDMGWELYPEAIFYVLKDLKRYNKPVYITENGLADARDENRGWFISESLKNISKAINEGIDVRGYFYWSLFDNFEWDKGFWPRFGLVEVDYKTMERKIRPSAYRYAEIIKENN
jgi:beta-glucosidase